MNATQQKKLSGELQDDLQALLDDALKECKRLKEKHDFAAKIANTLAEKMEIVAKERDSARAVILDAVQRRNDMDPAITILINWLHDHKESK